MPGVNDDIQNKDGKSAAILWELNLDKVREEYSKLQKEMANYEFNK